MLSNSYQPNMYKYSPITFSSNVGSGSPAGDITDPTWWDRFKGYTDNNGVDHNGFGVPMIQGISGLANAWMGFQNLSLAKKQFAFNKNFANQNFDQQTKLLNHDLYNQYLSRQSYDPERYSQDAASYMAQWGLNNSSGTNQWNSSTNTASAAPTPNNNNSNNPMGSFNKLRG
ncbi:MAG: hypothetical protein AXW14_08910 [Alteromonas sp. Nap_26]|nr:MAG: hypothetical protein AXW14_08910 [Alteromonas sp. Nap_26]